MELKNLDVFLHLAKQKTNIKIVVAAAEDDKVLSAVSEAKKNDVADFILVGNIEKIKAITSQLKIKISDFEIIDEPIPALAAAKAVSLINDNRAHVLMKGLVSTPDFLRAVLDKEIGLRKGDLLSHLGFFEIPAYPKLLALTDAAQNIAPGFEEKVSILKNSIDIFHRLGIEKPKVGILAAAETISLKMESTVHAALLTMMNKRGQIKGCIIDGPLGFDNIISKEAAEHKGIKSEVSGDADLILAPDINSANGLYKSFTYFGQATVAAIIVGAKVPIILTSRADTDRSKLMSIALAVSCRL